MADIGDAILCTSGCGNFMYPIGETDTSDIYECEACKTRHFVAATVGSGRYTRKDEPMT